MTYRPLLADSAGRRFLGQPVGPSGDRFCADVIVGSGEQYETIAAAHDALPNGGKIHVKSGTYSEDILITNPNIRIFGSGRQTIVQGTFTISEGLKAYLRISDLLIDCNPGQTNPSSTKVAIKHEAVSDNLAHMDFEHLHILRANKGVLFGKVGLPTENCSNESRFRHIIFEDCNYDIDFSYNKYTTSFFDTKHYGTRKRVATFSDLTWIMMEHLMFSSGSMDANAAPIYIKQGIDPGSTHPIYGGYIKHGWMENNRATLNGGIIEIDGDVKSPIKISDFCFSASADCSLIKLKNGAKISLDNSFLRTPTSAGFGVHLVSGAETRATLKDIVPISCTLYKQDAGRLLLLGDPRGAWEGGFLKVGPQLDGASDKEGGEIQLLKAPGETVSDPIIIDRYDDTLRLMRGTVHWIDMKMISPYDILFNNRALKQIDQILLDVDKKIRWKDTGGVERDILFMEGVSNMVKLKSPNATLHLGPDMTNDVEIGYNTSGAVRIGSASTKPWEVCINAGTGKIKMKQDIDFEGAKTILNPASTVGGTVPSSCDKWVTIFFQGVYYKLPAFLG